MKRIFSALIITLVFASCKKDDQPAALEAQELTNVMYGGNSQQNMDVSLPAGRSTDSTAIVLMIHGGAWSAGDKTDFAPYMADIKARLGKAALFNMNYRLAAAPYLFPAQEQDVKAALDFILSKTAEYHINKNKIILLGFSAGAHLALLQAYKYATPKVSAVVDFFGPTDLTDMYNHPMNSLVPLGLLSVVGATPATNATLYAQSSPVTFVNNQVPPTIILQGGSDPLVNPQQSQQLYQSLQSLHVTSQYVFYPAEGHGWTGAPMTDSFDKIQAFLNSVVHF